MSGLRVIDAASPREDRDAFCRYVRAVFPSVGFERWIEWGQWSRDYRAFSVFDGTEVVANASLYRMDLVLDGVAKAAWQFGAVGVRSEYRARGLADRSMKAALDAIGDAPALLFANPKVVDFYPRYGFQPRPEMRFYADVDVQPGALAPTADPGVEAIRHTINSLAKTAMTNRFGCADRGAILQWYLANALVSPPRRLSENCLVFVEQDGDELYILDVLSNEPVDLREHVHRLIARPIRRLRFGFTPDALWPAACAIEVDPESYLFVRGLNPTAPHKFPILAQT